MWSVVVLFPLLFFKVDARVYLEVEYRNDVEQQ